MLGRMSLRASFMSLRAQRSNLIKIPSPLMEEGKGENASNKHNRRNEETKTPAQ